MTLEAYLLLILFSVFDVFLLVDSCMDKREVGVQMVSDSFSIRSSDSFQDPRFRYLTVPFDEMDSFEKEVRAADYEECIEVCSQYSDCTHFRLASSDPHSISISDHESS